MWVIFSRRGAISTWLKSYVRSILTGDIFGLERYFNGVELRKIEARSYAEAKEAYRTITESFPDKKNFFLELAIDELISNAIFHGILQLSNLSREHWNEMMHTALQCPVKVNWCSDHEKIGISVEDPSGNLKKTDVLKWLDYHRRSGDANEHGRGFFLVRRLIDRLIINIEPNRRTECIIIQHFRRAKNDYHKPLLIHEV